MTILRFCVPKILRICFVVVIFKIVIVVLNRCQVSHTQEVIVCRICVVYTICSSSLSLSLTFFDLTAITFLALANYLFMINTEKFITLFFMSNV